MTAQASREAGGVSESVDSAAADDSTVARTATGLLTAEGSGVLVVPGLWGADAAVTAAEAVAGSAGTLIITGGVGGGGDWSDFVAALREADPGVNSLRAAHGAWRALGARGAVIIVRCSASLDSATMTAVAQAADTGSHRILVIAGHFDDLSEPFARSVSTGTLRWSRIEPLTPAALAVRLAELHGDTVPSVVLGRIHSLSGGHPALVDLLTRAAKDTGVLTFEPSGPVWRWDEAALQQGLTAKYPGLLAGFNGVYERIVTYTGLASVLRTSHLVLHFDSSMITSLRDAGILASYAGPFPRTALLQLGPAVLRWAVTETVSAGEDIAAWYDFGSAREGAASSGLALIALDLWRLRVEKTIDRASAADRAEEALAHGWHESAARFLAAVPPKAGTDRTARTVQTVPTASSGEGRIGAGLSAAGLELWLQVLRARTEWARGDADASLLILEKIRGDLWPEDGSTSRVGKHAAVLTLHLAAFHRLRGLAILAGLERGTYVGPAEVERALETARRAGLTLLPNVIGRLLVDDEDGALELVQWHGPSVDFIEEALSRLWVGGAAGMRSAHDFGRQVLSSLLDDLDREGGMPSLVESTRALLLIITMHVGWKVDDLRVNAREWNVSRQWHPGAHVVDQLIKSIVSMQDDRVGRSMRSALSAQHAVADRDAFGMHAAVLSMVAASASYLDDECADEHEEVARRAFARLDSTDQFPHFRFFVRGMVLIGSGPSTSEVSAQMVEVARDAAARGETAQQQQLLLLAVLGGGEAAIVEGLTLGGTRRSGRTTMIRMLSEALAAGSTGATLASDAADPLDTADVFTTAKVRYLAHVVLATQWARETAGGASASRRLIRMLLKANAELDESSWVLTRTAPELRLTPREQAIIRSLHDGESTGTIAMRLGLSPRTVEGIISGLLSRFSVANRLELVSLLGEFVEEPDTH